MESWNHVFSQYKKPVLVGVGITLTILPMIVVGLRFRARQFTRAAVGMDDWSILFALILCTATGVVEILAAEIGGMGQHQRLGPQGQLIHTPELTNYEKCRYINLVITTVNLGVIKISILLFYRRLFIVRPFKIASGIMMAIVASWTVAFASAVAAQCSPPSYFWEAFEVDYPSNCIQVQILYQGLAISDIVLDVLVLALPIPMVASLQLPWKTKIKVIDILLLGSVVLASGIARLVTFTQTVQFTTENRQEYFKDTPWYTAGTLFWLFAENAIAIIGACLPTLAPLWSQQHRSGSKGWLYFKNWSSFKGIWKSSGSSSYDNLEGRYPNTNNAEHASVGHLMAPGPATDIHAEDIALADMPPEGIQVLTTLSSNYRK